MILSCRAIVRPVMKPKQCRFGAATAGGGNTACAPPVGTTCCTYNWLIFCVPPESRPARLESRHTHRGRIVRLMHTQHAAAGSGRGEGKRITQSVRSGPVCVVETRTIVFQRTTSSERTTTAPCAPGHSPQHPLERWRPLTFVCWQRFHPCLTFPPCSRVTRGTTREDHT